MSRLHAGLVHSRLAAGLARLRRGAGRLPVLLVVALAAVLVAGTAVILRGNRVPAGDPTVGDVVRVGVTDGDDVPAYLAASRRELAARAGTGPATEVYALVSLTGYTAPDGLAALLDGVSVAEVYARVPLPGVQTQIVRLAAYRVPADVVAGMTEIAGRKDAEAADDRRQAVSVTGTGEGDRQLRATYLSGAQIAAAEADAYRAGCACVYAVVVRAAPAALTQVAARSGVRVVDPAPEVRRLDRSVFRAPLPEQTGRVRPPGGAPWVATSGLPGAASPSPSAADPAPPAGGS